MLVSYTECCRRATLANGSVIFTNRRLVHLSIYLVPWMLGLTEQPEPSFRPSGLELCPANEGSDYRIYQENSLVKLESTSGKHSVR